MGEFPVEQVDREAAATAYAKQRSAIEAEHSQILRGLRDDHYLVQAFASHRIEALREAMREPKAPSRS